MTRFLLPNISRVPGAGWFRFVPLALIAATALCFLGHPSESRPRRDRQTTLLRRSEGIMRAIDAISGPARLSIFDGGLLAGGGAARNLLQVTAEDSAGNALAQCLWDRRSGALLEVLCWHGQGLDREPGAALTRAQGVRQALYWLRRIGAIPAGERSSEVTLRVRNSSTLTYRIRWGQGEATVLIDSRSGELVDARFEPDSGVTMSHAFPPTSP